MRTMIRRALGLAGILASGVIAATLPYQGLATDAKGNPRQDGEGLAVFSLYGAATGGSALWSETQSMATRKGLFAANLGLVAAIPDSLFDGRPLYLGVAIDGADEALPRLALGTVPFAHGAGRAEHAATARLADTATGAHHAEHAHFAERSDSARAARFSGISRFADTAGRAAIAGLADSAKVVAGLRDSIVALRAALAGKDSVRASRKADTAAFALASSGLPGGNASGNLLTWDGSNWVAKNLVVGIAGGSQPSSVMQPYTVLNYQIALEGIFPSRSGMDPYIGEIMITPYNFAVRGYAMCDGQIMSIAQNTALFSLLGTTFGGNGQTTFALPDLRGRVPMHMGQGPGLRWRTIGEQGGVESRSLTITEIPAHSHVVSAP